MYNTYDVHFYASWALATLWPKLSGSISKDYGVYIHHHAARLGLSVFIILSSYMSRLEIVPLSFLFRSRAFVFMKLSGSISRDYGVYSSPFQCD